VTISPSIDSAASTRKSLFSVATNLQSKFKFTPGVTVAEDTKNVQSTLIYLNGDSTTGADKGGNTPISANKADGTARASGGVSGDKTRDAHSSENVGYPSTSNSRLAEVKSKLHPKTAEILANRRAHGSGSFRSYYGVLHVLENQNAFADAGIC